MNSKNTDPTIKSFRLTTKKKISIKCYSQQKADSESSQNSSTFSSQYNLLAKKLRIKTSKFCKPMMGQTVSSFCGGLASFRLKTQSSYQPLNQRYATKISYFPISPVSKTAQSKQILSHHQSNSGINAKKQLKLRFSTHAKPRKNFKIQKPSIYWQMKEQKNQISMVDKQNKQKDEQLIFSAQSSKIRVKLLQNTQFLWNIRKHMVNGNNKIKPKDIIKVIKSYLIRKQQKQDPSKSLQKLFFEKSQQNDFKQIIACERAIIIGIVQLINIEKLHTLCIECASILDNVIGLYHYLLKILFANQPKFYQSSTGYKQFQILTKEITDSQVQDKKCISSTLLFLYTKMQIIYRHSSNLLKKVRQVLSNSNKNSINRTFYQLLTCFAVHLNYNYSESDLNIFLNSHVSSFMTCPSPFIIQARKKRQLSLVLDLDETILHTKFTQALKTSPNKKYFVQYRPYYRQFLSKISGFYEIIIYTSSMSDYAEEVTSTFANHISHVLCRQHTIKVKGGTIKDINRIGRDIKTTIIVDNLAENLKLQQQNGILIKSWYGDINDQQLAKLQQILIAVVKMYEKHQDIRPALKQAITNIKNRDKQMLSP